MIHSFDSCCSARWLHCSACGARDESFRFLDSGEELALQIGTAKIHVMFWCTKEGSITDKNGSALDNFDSGLSGSCFQTFPDLQTSPSDPNLSHGLRGRRDTLRMVPAEELGVSLEETLVCIPRGDESNARILPSTE